MRFLGETRFFVELRLGAGDFSIIEIFILLIFWIQCYGNNLLFSLYNFLFFRLYNSLFLQLSVIESIIVIVWKITSHREHRGHGEMSDLSIIFLFITLSVYSFAL